VVLAQQSDKKNINTLFWTVSPTVDFFLEEEGEPRLVDGSSGDED
jgi:hypothetical protein